MAVFRAFKPEAMNKIAGAMGYTGNMDSFQQYIEQDPARKARMDGFVKAAQTMAKGGMVRKMANGGAIGTGGLAANGGFQQNYQSAPMYDQFKQSDYYKNMPMIGATVTGGATIDGQTYNFPMAMESKAYKDYMNSLGGYQVGAQKSSPATVGGEFTGGVVPNMAPGGEMDGPGLFPGETPPGGALFNATPAVVVYDPKTGQQYGDANQANQAGVSNPVMSLPPGISPIPMQSGPKMRYDQVAEPAQPAPTPAAPQTTPANIGDVSVQRMLAPGIPQGGVTTAAMTPTGPGQEIAQGTGALTGAVAVPTAMAQTATATPQQESQANVMEAATAAPAVDAAMNATQAAQAMVDPRAEVTAAQQTATSVGNLSAAQGNATLIDNPVQRSIQAGELINGAADAQTAATFTEQVQAATATPSTQATVQGQLASLTANFDAANPPAWAAGAMRNATAAMAARGLGASSLAGQAIVQATLESALPIAQADAATVAQFEAQNLSNRQQRAMLSAQQRATFMGMEFDQAFQSRVQNSARIGDIANMNFTAEQQVQLENSRATNTMNLNNLSNSQAMTMAEAAALAQMDSSNLNNRQQAAVNNAQTFLQTDMANLSNQQQTELFKAQQRTQSMFTDQAATNAAAQFNATSQNQVDQFFSNLAQQTSQFNATQQNAQSQFNAGQANTVNRFNAEMNNQRDQFNSQNQTVIAQSNAQWRRQIATADTAAVNRANEINAAAILGISDSAYNNMWSYYSDTMEWAWNTAENEAQRAAQIAVAHINADASKDIQKIKGDYESSAAVGGFVTDVLKIGLTGGKFSPFG